MGARSAAPTDDETWSTKIPMFTLVLLRSCFNWLLDIATAAGTSDEMVRLRLVELAGRNVIHFDDG